jgi:hypothetical protein
MSMMLPASMFDVLVLIVISIFIIIVIVVVVIDVIIMIETYSIIVPIAIVVGNRTPLLGYPADTPPLIHIDVPEPLVLQLGPDLILATLPPRSFTPILIPIDIPPPPPPSNRKNTLSPRPLTLPTRRRLRGVDVPEVAFGLVAATIQAGSV